MATEEDVAAGLINWVNSLKATDPVFTVDDLATGEVLWRVLQRIDHLAFPGSLPEDALRLDLARRDRESWIPKWANLKHLYDALSIFLIEDCNQTLPIFEASPGSGGGHGHRVNPDLKAIAQHSSLPDAIVLLKLCVVAATNCDDRQVFLEGMQELSEHVQLVLVQTLREVQHEDEQEGGEEEEEEEEKEEEEQDGEEYHEEEEEGFNRNEREEEPRLVDKQPAPSVLASDLASEERLAKVIAENNRTLQEKRDLQRHIDELKARYDSLRERYDRSQGELNQANDRLSAVLTGRAEGGASKEAKNEAVIAQLEARVSEYEGDLDSLRKTNEVLKIKAERVQKLQDDYDEIKIERDSLSRKANAAEKYRAKLEATQDLDRENATLKQRVADLQAQLRQSDSRTASSSDLQREIDEYRRLLPAIEQERHEVNEMKKRLEFDYHLLQARYSESEEQLRRTRLEVEDLQGRLRDYDDGFEPERQDKSKDGDEDATPIETQDLESEEADFAAAEARLTEALPKDNSTNMMTTAPNGGSTTYGNEDELDTTTGISEDELHAIISAMRAQMQAGTAHERESGMKIQKKMVIMLEKVRSRNISLLEHVKRQSGLIQDLQRRPAPAVTEEVQEKEKEPEVLKEPRTESELELEVEEQAQLIDNLKREIKLVSSAWYEQNQRLATLGSGSGAGAVALMRLKGAGGNGLEEPRSFLGRQRKMLSKVALGESVRVTRG